MLIDTVSINIMFSTTLYIPFSISVLFMILILPIHHHFKSHQIQICKFSYLYKKDATFSTKL